MTSNIEAALKDVLKPHLDYERELVRKLSEMLVTEEVEALWVMVSRIRFYGGSKYHRQDT